MVPPHFSWHITEHQKSGVIKSLREDILLNPQMRHRLILRAIETEKDPEVRKLIRWYNKRGLI